MYATMRTRSVIFATAFCTSGIISVYCKETLFAGEKYENPILATNKRVIITGATSGIGVETARELADRQAHVYIACRNMKKCKKIADDIIQDTENENVHCLECDLSSMESIRKFVEKYKEKEQRLDILINNAAVSTCRQAKTIDGIEMQLGVNHIGHFLLTNLLLDLIKKSAPSRIINVSCSSHHDGKINTDDLNSEKKYNAKDAYNQSKFANILFTRNLARRVTGTGVTVNAVDPGRTTTQINRHILLFNGLLGWIINPWINPISKTPAAGAQTTIFAALDPSINRISGLYFSECAKGEIAESARSQKMSEWLWQVSEKWTGVTNVTNERKMKLIRNCFPTENIKLKSNFDGIIQSKNCEQFTKVSKSKDS